MSTQLMGYRLPAKHDPPRVIRSLVRRGGAVRAETSLAALAHVLSALLIGAPQERDLVLAKLSGHQVGADHLTLSKAGNASLISYAAEFIDALHVNAHGTTSMPLEPGLDLRFEIRFYDDPEPTEVEWLYAIVMAGNQAMRRSWEETPDVVHYPLPDPDDQGSQEQAERQATWTRVTHDFVHVDPLSWRAVDPQLVFEVAEARSGRYRDEDLERDGNLTIARVKECVRQIMGDDAPDGLETLLDQRLLPDLYTPA